LGGNFWDSLTHYLGKKLFLGRKFQINFIGLFPREGKNHFPKGITG